MSCAIYRQFFDSVLDFCCIATDGQFIHVNPAFCKALGYTAKELCRQQMADFIHPDDVGDTLHEMEKLLVGSPVAAFENRYRTKTGTYLSLYWTAYPVEETWFCIARDVTFQKKAQEKRHAWAMRDFLTGLSSRRQFEVSLHEEIGKNDQFFLVFADVDNFKVINDKQGHEAGDDVLRDIAETLKAACRSGDHPFRVGGDEFAVIMQNCENPEPFTKRVLENCKHSVSIGWSKYPDNGRTPSELMKYADGRMYHNKSVKKSG